jgi:FlaA1/EpsC-like NDP-sugar epimerase
MLSDSNSDISQRRRGPVQAALVCSDLTAWVVAVLTFTGLRFDLDPTGVISAQVLAVGAVAGLVFVVMAAGVRLYSGRHGTGSFDEALLLVLIGGFVALTLTSVIAQQSGVRWVPVSVPLAAGAVATVWIVMSRVTIRWWRERFARTEGGVRALVVGAGDAGARLVRDLILDANSPYEPVAMVDDDSRKRHFRVGIVRVEGTVADIPALVAARQVDQVLIAAPSAGPDLIRRVASLAMAAGVKAKSLPTLAQLTDDAVGFRDLRDLELSDFLGRHQVSTDLSSVAHLLAGKTVLVTGAGGSIGSEICLQVQRFGPGRLLKLDRDESALHALQLRLEGRALLECPSVILADIRDEPRIQAIFQDHCPDIVFHAAALKHLPMLQMYPEEALKTNVLGTATVLRAAAEAGTQLFVNISTDKAADPVSVLGESKYLAERLTAGTAELTGRPFGSVRFGNVLGSRGSVLTAFAEQIAGGGPVTVTDPEVTRFFMTVHEAVQLVLQAAALGTGGETFILDMGEPVRIMDVARQLIALSGRQIDVELTGLRAGEKLHEDLGGVDEISLPTAHPLITRTSPPPLPPAFLRRIQVDEHGSIVIALDFTEQLAG